MSIKPTSSILFGFLLSLFCAAGAWLISKLPFPPFSIEGQNPIDPLAIAIFLGMGLRSLGGSLADLKRGFKWTNAHLLSVSIALLGARLNFFHIIDQSSSSLLISMICVLVALWLTPRIAEGMFGVTQPLSTLISIGTAICGGTAIAVTSSTLKARDEEIVLAITCVTLCGLLCVFIMPPLGHLLGTAPEAFGVWVGVSVHATPQVLAAAFAYHSISGEVALVVKLTRVLLLAPLLLWLRAVHHSRASTANQIAASKSSLKFFTLFPPFLIAFLTLAGMNTLKWLPETLPMIEYSTDTVVRQLSKWFMMIAMSAIGLSVEIKSLKQVGSAPLKVGLLATLIMVVLGWSLISLTLPSS